MASNDWATFAEFVAARSAALHRAAYLMVGDVGLAQDLVQEALIRTYVAWSRLRDPANAEAYTRRAITTIAIDWSRRKSRSAGQQITLNLPGDPVMAQPLVWLDDTTVQVVSFDVDLDQQPLQVNGLTFYRCTLPAGTCEVAAEVGSKPEHGAFPGGRYSGTP